MSKRKRMSYNEEDLELLTVLPQNPFFEGTDEQRKHKDQLDSLLSEREIIISSLEMIERNISLLRTSYEQKRPEPKYSFEALSCDVIMHILEHETYEENNRENSFDVRDCFGYFKSDPRRTPHLIFHSIILNSNSIPYYIPKGVTKLKILRFSKAMETVLTMCKSLLELEIKTNSDAFLIRLLPQLTCLHKLKVYSKYRPHEIMFQSDHLVPLLSPSIVDVQLAGRLTTQGVESLFKQLPKLISATIILERDNLMPQHIPPLKKLFIRPCSYYRNDFNVPETIEKLELNEFVLSQPMLVLITSLPKLKSFCMSDDICWKISESTIKFKSTQLTSLMQRAHEDMNNMLENCVPHHSIQNLVSGSWPENVGTYQRNIRKIELIGYTTDGDKPKDSISYYKLQSLLDQLPNLTSLTLTNYILLNSGLDQLTVRKNLQKVVLHNCYSNYNQMQWLAKNMQVEEHNANY
jgi:hypothetical protein